MTAADNWRTELAAWEIPEHLLAAVDDSPYRWPVELFRRRNITAAETEAPPTFDIVSRLAGAGGSVLDIGAGTGRASLPLAISGHPVTAVERSAEMASALREEAAAIEGRYEVIEEAWPVSTEIGAFDVVMAAHVVYDVSAIEPFLAAMAAHARRGVVLEMTETHPWTPLGPYYRALHGIERPAGPSVDDLVAVIREVFEVAPEVVRWERPGGTWFESWEEIEEVYRRRLVLPPDRIGELRALLGPDLAVIDSRMTLGDTVRRLATVWWTTGD
ncbi:MAG: class I SAM-dependent methyltransferase [Acidimicrobiia bacterium]